ncbi:helix-turn-helix DNA binding protein [Gordonia phage Emianna]|uniref:Helix-turn-helix DNA binding protein n=1 Tax=Gordonia phage Emianna TaxID=2315530 RepID=A0A386KDP2_9CAUD|nr:helix-turn-helix DNA binding protein [Gordonia phage Emianna]AYD83462.1 helix-turn-helix DNA binding protein [Gordonia phage Emianna]AYD84349.1 helix-turn-helix DNA binding protein [Gordonia phage Kurt]
MRAVYRGVSLNGTPAEIADFLSKWPSSQPPSEQSQEPMRDRPYRRSATKSQRRPLITGLTDDLGRDLQALTDVQFATYSMVESTSGEEVTAKGAATILGLNESAAYSRLTALVKIGLLEKVSTTSGTLFRLLPQPIGESVRYIPDSEIPSYDSELEK